MGKIVLETMSIDTSFGEFFCKEEQRNCVVAGGGNEVTVYFLGEIIVNLYDNRNDIIGSEKNWC